MAHVMVVGAGVVGVSTALLVQENAKGSARVTLVSERFSPNTTSDVAAGLWEPHNLRDTPLELQRRWSEATRVRLAALYASEEAPDAGVTLLSGYQMFDTQQPDPFWRDQVYGFRHMTAEELAAFPGHTCGFSFSTYLCENVRYLPYLMRKFRENGGKIVQRKMKNLDEALGEADVVVNCTGIGAREFAADAELRPNRGQLVRVRAPWVKRFIISEVTFAHFFPGRDHVILGGVQQEDDWRLEPDDDVTRRILDDCAKLMPSLKKAEVVNVRAGLRPSRRSVRLELEWRHLGRKRKPVVHNYGHGGGGVTLHWGCAQDAAQLVLRAIAHIKHAQL